VKLSAGKSKLEVLETCWEQGGERTGNGKKEKASL